MNDAIRNYQGGCVFGQLQVDKVKNVTAAFSPGGTDDAPWIRELKLYTAEWKDCAVYYSYKGNNFNPLTVSESGEYPPHLYVWVEEKENGRIVKMKAFSSAELELKMRGVRERRTLKFDGRPCESLTKFVVDSFKAEDPAAAAQARDTALGAMKALLQEAVKRDEGING